MKFEAEKTYTMFNAFHHFNEEDQNTIVSKIINANSKAYIVEILEPTIFTAIKVLFATSVGVLLFTPFVKPFSIGRLFFTYVIPMNVFTITYDGILSTIKSKSKSTYQKIFKDNTERIKVERLNSGISPLILIQINPK
jgi:hypothetical protein